MTGSLSPLEGAQPLPDQPPIDRAHLPDLNYVLNVLEQLRPLTAYGLVGSKDVVQAQRRGDLDAAINGMRYVIDRTKRGCTSAAPVAQAAPAQPMKDLRKFLDAAAGEGFTLDGIDAADLYNALFQEASARTGPSFMDLLTQEDAIQLLCVRDYLEVANAGDALYAFAHFFDHEGCLTNPWTQLEQRALPWKSEGVKSAPTPDPLAAPAQVAAPAAREVMKQALDSLNVAWRDKDNARDAVGKAIQLLRSGIAPSQPPASAPAVPEVMPGVPLEGIEEVMTLQIGRDRESGTWRIAGPSGSGLYLAGQSLDACMSDVMPAWRFLTEHAPKQVPAAPAALPVEPSPVQAQPMDERELWAVLHEWHEATNPERQDALEHEINRMFFIARAAAAAHQGSAPTAGEPATPVVWRPMETAPTDGTMVRLLVDYTDGDHPLEDAEQAWTIGGNTDSNVGPGEGEGWKFAGWCWTQDCFTEGRGKPIGWLPFHATEQKMVACKTCGGYGYARGGVCWGCDGSGKTLAATPAAVQQGREAHLPSRFNIRPGDQDGEVIFRHEPDGEWVRWVDITALAPQARASQPIEPWMTSYAAVAKTVDDTDYIETTVATTKFQLYRHEAAHLHAILGQALVAAPLPHPEQPQPESAPAQAPAVPLSYVELLADAEQIVRQKPTYRRFIDGTPLANDVPVWMVNFAFSWLESIYKITNEINGLDAYVTNRRAS